MRKPVVAMGVLLGLVWVSPASASYYFSTRGAQSAARSFVNGHYIPDGHVVASCRPQGLNAADPRFVYHRWVCGWSDEALCGGQVRIIGSRNRWYLGRIMHGVTCDEVPAIIPPTPPVAPPRPPSIGACNPNYSGACLDRPGDYDCIGGTGDGPNYTGRVFVIGVDVYDLDRDGNGVGCE